jgi:formate dehydrogenase gamma subunit
MRETRVARGPDVPGHSLSPARVLRFTSSERAFHWLVAAAFFVLLLTGLLMGKHGSFHNVMYTMHLASAGVLLAGIGVTVLGGDRQALSRTRRELSSLDAVDREWLARVPAAVFKRSPGVPAGRFNAGQKLNFLLVAALFAALFVSGLGLIAIGGHPVNAVFKTAHVVAAYLAAVLVVGHLYMALVNPSTRPALRGMISGSVDSGWVRKYHSRLDAAERLALGRYPGGVADRHPHEQLIREFHDHQNRFYAGGAQEPAGAMLADDVTWHVPGHSALAGDHRGRDEVLRYFARRRELADATFQIEVRGVLADDDRAVILAACAVKCGGEMLTWSTVAMFRITNGRIAECWVMPYDEHAFDQIWSSVVHSTSRL